MPKPYSCTIRTLNLNSNSYTCTVDCRVFSAQIIPVDTIPPACNLYLHVKHAPLTMYTRIQSTFKNYSIGCACMRVAAAAGPTRGPDRHGGHGGRARRRGHWTHRRADWRQQRSRRPARRPQLKLATALSFLFPFSISFRVILKALGTTRFSILCY